MASLSDISTVMVEKRSATLASVDPFRIQTMEGADLLQLQTSLGYGDVWGRWEAPEEWCAKGANNRRRVRCDAVGSEDGDRLWTEALRLCLLLSLTRSTRRYAVPITVCARGRSALKLGLLALAKDCRTGTWWSRVSDEEALAFGLHERMLCKVLRSLFRRGLLQDAPQLPPMDMAPLELDYAGQDEPEMSVEESRPMLPLPDGFTAACGQRVMWLVEHAGATLIDCLDACVRLELPAPKKKGALPNFQRKETTAKSMLTDLRNELIESWSWTDSDGSPLTNLPFEIHLSFKKGFGGQTTFHDFQWPPTRWNTLLQLVRTLQTCHLWLLFLGSGPRHSTILSYTTDSLMTGPTGARVEAFQYKQGGQYEGSRRDWPLAPAMVLAMKRQIRLASIVKRLGPSVYVDADHLWVQFRGTSAAGSSRGGPLQHLNHSVDDLVDAFGLRALLGEGSQKLHTHRFRKTLARILALSLTSAQTILMDCFGHEDAEMTLGYMLSDKTVVADAMRVQRELVILMARDVILEPDAHGGAMAAVVEKARHRFMRHKKTSALSPVDAYELADQLTLGGRQWMFVMEGVICTLPHLDRGPCAEGSGARRDPANCQPDCSHQLILAHYKNRTNDMIAYIVKQILRAEDDEAELLLATLVGQLNNHLHRWPDVRAAWLSHPVIRKHGEIKLSAHGQLAEEVT